jgi:hypothetical protein
MQMEHWSKSLDSSSAAMVKRIKIDNENAGPKWRSAKCIRQSDAPFTRVQRRVTWQASSCYG